MKKLILLLLTLTTFSISSCSSEDANKHPLDGEWRFTQFVNYTGEITNYENGITDSKHIYLDGHKYKHYYIFSNIENGRGSYTYKYSKTEQLSYVDFVATYQVQDGFDNEEFNFVFKDDESVIVIKNLGGSGSDFSYDIIKLTDSELILEDTSQGNEYYFKK